ncbi:sigma-70 family RNA polymerase sigma factor [Azonexus hydrophilus]|uniref:sigma-70 family RNA polymerase sigma factor n=1 Tax=Azonexus hydrophilus TaxID=418702 RepID=UPI0024921503|nr:sigma-70 family RNA polymerase sigma factor [Azonexus hydrophilus]
MPDDRPCLSRAWRETRGELLGWLRHRLDSEAEADDLLQEVFLRALRQGDAFCTLDNPRAWLFQVARNALTDRLRSNRPPSELSDDLAATESELPATVDQLTQCLPRVLGELSAADRLAIELCDIAGQPQQVLAEKLGISLSGAKSRLQRARQRLKVRLIEGCQVCFDAEGQVAGFVPRPPPKR